MLLSSVTPTKLTPNPDLAQRKKPASAGFSPMKNVVSSRVKFRDFFPIHHVPKRFEVIGPTVLVFEVIGVFPYIATEYRRSETFGHPLHERIVLVGRRANAKRAVLLFAEPNPTATEPSNSGRLEFRFELVEASERGFDRISEFPRWLTARLGSNRPPKHTVIEMSAAIIPDRTPDIFGHFSKVRNQRLDGQRFEFGAFDCIVEFRDISGVVFAVMDFHRLRVEVGFERVFRIS